MKTTKRKRETSEAAKKAKAAPSAVVDEPIVHAADPAPAPAVSTPPPPSAADEVVLASHCTVKDAAALKASLCAVLSNADPVKIDARNLERIDTSSMQLLCAFVRDRAASQRAVEWVGPPSTLYSAARLLGIAPLLQLPEGPAA